MSHQADQRELGEFDNVDVAIGNHPFDPLCEELLAAGFAVKVVGDAMRRGKVRNAVSSGHGADMTV